jgi:predicted 3-demethylubiquinone-9 3-methyltransferase (glyoxalase superfamily)
LWFKSGAEEAAEFYISIFPDSRILDTTRYNDSVAAVADQEAGSVMTVSFVLAGQEFAALNGGPAFAFNESVSFMVLCDTQADVDYFGRLATASNAQMCGGSRTSSACRGR